MREQDWEMLADITGDSIEPEVTPRSNDSVRVMLSDVRQRRATLDDIANLRWPDMSIEQMMQICDAVQNVNVEPTAQMVFDMLTSRIDEQETTIGNLNAKIVHLETIISELEHSNMVANTKINDLYCQTRELAYRVNRLVGEDN